MEHVTFIDSNILCYYLDADTEEHAAVVKKLKKTLERTTPCINTIVLLEVSHYLIKHLGAVKGKECAQKLLRSPVVVLPVDLPAARAAIDELAAHTHTGIGGRDASVIASMKKAGIKRLITHDKAFNKVSEIEVIDPIS